MKAYPWSALQLVGPFRTIIGSAPKGEPERFIPVFQRREDAVAWVGDGDFVMELKES
jgi:hypothetical protein